MKILAIEASGPVAGCALLEDGTLTAEYSVQYKKKHSQSLVPMLSEMKEMVDLDLASIDMIAVTAGPGSFTGLRIGAATVKGLGLALEKPVLPVPTVDSLACNLYVRPQCVVAFTEIAEELNRLGREVVFLGDGVPVNEGLMREQMQVPYLIAPAHLNRQRAASTAVRAAQIYEEKGEAALISADDFRPEYLRIPQAERERGDKRNYKVFVE